MGVEAVSFRCPIRHGNDDGEGHLGLQTFDLETGAGSYYQTLTFPSFPSLVLMHRRAYWGAVNLSAAAHVQGRDGGRGAAARDRGRGEVPQREMEFGEEAPPAASPDSSSPLSRLIKP